MLRTFASTFAVSEKVDEVSLSSRAPLIYFVAVPLINYKSDLVIPQES